MSINIPAQPPTLRDQLVQSPLLIAGLALAFGGLIGGITAFGPLYAVAGLLALALATTLLVSVKAGLIAALAIATIIPFGTLPFKAIITPNFLTVTLVTLNAVWFLRALARSDTYDVRFGSLGLPLIGFLGLTLFSLILGARGLPDPQTLHNYAKFVLGVFCYLTVINCVRDRDTARLVVRALIIVGGISALIGLILWVLPDATALQLLVALGRIGYPTSGRVLRYVEDDPNGLERAIGLNVDPNSFGGMLALVAVLTLTQLAAPRPLLPRWLLATLGGIQVLTLLLTFSRAALFGLVIAAAYLATVQYRRLWRYMIIAGVTGGVLLMGLGYADDFINRVLSGVQFRDQAQQMRLDEYANAIAIIQRYPVFGIGFGAAPDLDLSAGVSSIYLAIAQRMGLVGLIAFIGLIGFWYTRSLDILPQLDDESTSWLLGCQGAVVAALAVGLADHYFFNIEFSHMATLLWCTMGLGSAIEWLINES
ncbi:O-antigen ligase family protein [Chloroflexus aggregans]|uniref:O-antigen polymerase n=1 Tax=Chloroflexus aggregans (strain MD-66 / DSM 9485) TaxID=326427 RepID=B8G4V7_CHLAD|nr:O-antigen ligase family protein [Chloroflexus aggregans]ACL23590.1 O-antigen polymerase [Chloroflexus aggregans DSM 9485]